MTEAFVLDRRALLAGLGALAVPSSAFAAPKEFPKTQALIDGYIKDKRLANMVVAIKRGAKPVDYLQGGTLALDTDIKAGPDSIYRIYSMTKLLTGVGFMTLVDKGLLRIDQPITDVLPEFKDQRVLTGNSLTQTRPAASPILMRHLVTHTAGLSYGINRGPLADAYNSYGLGAGGRLVAAGLVQPTDKFPPARDLETFVRRLATLPLDFDPGTKWQYSVGLDVMGLIIQRVSGMPFSDYLQETIFKPLKMVDTDFVVRKSQLPRFTSNFTGQGGVLKVSDDRKASPYAMDRDLPSGGGGGVSTARDYIRFLSMMANNGTYEGVKILSPAAAKAAHTNMMNPGVFTSGFGGVGNTFGAAFQLLGKASAAGEGEGTYGWDGIAGTTAWVDPVHNVAVCGLVQIQNGISIHNPLRVAVYQDLKAQGYVK